MNVCVRLLLPLHNLIHHRKHKEAGSKSSERWKKVIISISNMKYLTVNYDQLMLSFELQSFIIP